MPAALAEQTGKEERRLLGTRRTKEEEEGADGQTRGGQGFRRRERRGKGSPVETTAEGWLEYLDVARLLIRAPGSLGAGVRSGRGDGDRGHLVTARRDHTKAPFTPAVPCVSLSDGI